MPRSNDSVSWDDFDPETYFQYYYGDPHSDDDQVVEAVCSFLSGLDVGEGLDLVDVGTGPSLIPFLCALPKVRRLTAWEYSHSNVEWLRNEIGRAHVRPQFAHFWEVVRRAYADASLPDDPAHRLREIATVRQGSIFDLPARTWDAATMFFCADSITSDKAEFMMACARFAGCVRPGGPLVAAFLVNASEMVVEDQDYPVMTLSAQDVMDAFSGLAADCHVSRIGVRGEEIRSAYSGMIFLTAIAV
jgi:hypothetical protein